MPTTSNFGWTTPADTDLVKDGAAAIRTLGNGIDTSFVDLKGGTTGQNLRKATNTDLDFTWAGDATNTVVDAEGDLLVGDSADTLQRLAIGTTGQVLTADTTIDGKIKWAAVAADSMTLLSTTTLSGAETVISSISQNYTNLFITVQNVTLDATGRIYFIPNATSNLTYVTTNNSASTTASSAAYQGNVGYLAYSPNMLNTGGNNSWTIIITNYANTTSYKSFSFNGIYRDSGNTFDSGIMAGGGIEANDAITAITFTHNQTSFNAGTVKIYGVK